MQSQLKLAEETEAAELASLKARGSQRLLATRDLAGVRKQALLATPRGDVFSLHTGDGRVLWRTQLDADDLPMVALKVARMPHSASEDIEVR